VSKLQDGATWEQSDLPLAQVQSQRGLVPAPFLSATELSTHLESKQIRQANPMKINVWGFFWWGCFLPGQLSKQATSSLHTTERKAAGPHELKKNKKKHKPLSVVEGQRGSGGMGLSLFSTAAENYVKLDAMPLK